MYNKCLVLEIEYFPDQNTSPFLYVSVWDHDAVVADDFIGSAIVNVADVDQFYKT